MRRAAALLLFLVLTVTACSASSGPGYCSAYDDWADADRDMRALEAEYGNRVTDWPPGKIAEYESIVNIRGSAAHRLWARAPAGADWASVRAACR